MEHRERGLLLAWKGRHVFAGAPKDAKKDLAAVAKKDRAKACSLARPIITELLKEVRGTWKLHMWNAQSSNSLGSQRSASLTISISPKLMLPC